MGLVIREGMDTARDHRIPAGKPREPGERWKSHRQHGKSQRNTPNTHGDTSNITSGNIPEPWEYPNPAENTLNPLETPKILWKHPQIPLKTPQILWKHIQSI